MGRWHPSAEETEWMARAACGDKPDSLFYLADRERYKPGRFAEAEKTCRSCPVLRECDDFATRTKQKWGYWALRDRGEAKHAQRIAKEEEQALQAAGLPVPSDEGSPVLRLALSGEAAGGGPDEGGA